VPAAPDGTVVVADNEAAERYEVRVGDDLAGIAQYRRKPGQIAFVHTEVGDRFEGMGLGSQLISHALGEARDQGLAVLPFCPFVKGYIARHAEYMDLVPEGRREAFGL